MIANGRDKSEGILCVAFGDEYRRSAAAAMRRAAEILGLPVRVITNAEPGGLDWPADTTFEIMDGRPDEDNRAVRVAAVNHTPFDRTLLLDADAWVADEAVKLPFGYLKQWDAVGLAYRMLANVASNDQWGPIIEELGTADHRAICGGVMWFNKNSRVRTMFRRWAALWAEDGRGRDMPALMRAVWTSRVRILLLPGVNTWIGVHCGHIRHSAGSPIPQLPAIVKYKPNGIDDRGRQRAWIPVDCRGRRPPKRGRTMSAAPPKPAAIDPEAQEPEAAAVAPRAAAENTNGVRPMIARILRKYGPAGRGRLKGAEIGVWKGDHAAAILEALQPAELILVDPWEPDEQYSDWNLKRYGRPKWSRWRRTDWNGLYRAVVRRFADRPEVRIHRMPSAQAERIIKPGRIDFVYIDGNHSYQAVREDVRLWWRMVRPGGILGGHDYHDRQPGVIRAVDEMAAALGLRLHHEQKDWWIDKPPRNQAESKFAPLQAGLGLDVREFTIGTDERLPFEDAEFDAALCISTLIRVSIRRYIPAVLGEMARVLRTGGPIVAGWWKPDAAGGPEWRDEYIPPACTAAAARIDYGGLKYEFRRMIKI